MGNTGYNYGALTHFAISATPVDGTAIADGAGAICDAIDLDGYFGCAVSVYVVEDGTGACDGNFYTSILGTDLDPDSEGYQTGPTTGPVYTDVVGSGGVIDPVQSTTRKAPPVLILAANYPKFKLHFLNDAGQGLEMTANYVLIDIPVAS